jgi:hypothetical protein
VVIGDNRKHQPDAFKKTQWWVVTLVADGESNRSFVLVQDGKTMEEIARAYIPIILPYTSHGYFDVEKGGDKDASVVPGFKNSFKA